MAYQIITKTHRGVVGDPPPPLTPMKQNLTNLFRCFERLEKQVKTMRTMVDQLQLQTTNNNKQQQTTTTTWSTYVRKRWRTLDVFNKWVDSVHPDTLRDIYYAQTKERMGSRSIKELTETIYAPNVEVLE